jgi:hypothetical protein
MGRPNGQVGKSGRDRKRISVIEIPVTSDAPLRNSSIQLLDHPSRLPPNTLLLSLAPTGDLYYLPPSSPSRPASATGYASDSELASASHKSKPPTRSEIVQQSRRETRMKRSASWADVVKLTTLYTVARDTRDSLEEVVQNTDMMIEQGGPILLVGCCDESCSPVLTFGQAREVSEREEHIKTLRREISAVKQGCTSGMCRPNPLN